MLTDRKIAILGLGTMGRTLATGLLATESVGHDACSPGMGTCSRAGPQNEIDSPTYGPSSVKSASIVLPPSSYSASRSKPR